MNDPGEPANPLQGLLGDLLKVIGSTPGGSRPWLDAARALAHGVATDGAPEGNADPIVRIRLEEIARVAELHVADASGLDVSGPDGRPMSFSAVGRGTMALRTLDAWTPLLTKMVAAQEAAAPRAGMGELGLGDLGLGELGLGDDEDGGLGALLGRFAATMGPVLLGMQFGSAAGHLARRALGQYALPVPWPPSSELLVVPDNVAAFADDWSLPHDETQLWVCVRELTTNAVLHRPHVGERLQELLEAAATESVAVQSGLAERLGGELGSPDALQGFLSDPESLLADLLTPGARRTSAQLVAIVTAVGAYVDHVTARVATSLTGAAGPLTEAWYRYRVADAKGEQAAGALFGIDLGREQVDRGAAFVRGVLERAGEEGLARLWESPSTLPTPAELDAPGLWLERISLTLDASPGSPAELGGASGETAPEAAADGVGGGDGGDGGGEAGEPPDGSGGGPTPGSPL